MSDYIINLKDQISDVETYQWHVGDEFFAKVAGPEISQGDVEVALEVKKTIADYILRFSFRGTLVVTCDRCLEPMQQPVDGEQELRVKLGADFDDDGEVITISEEDGTLDVSWSIYELLALEIPIRHVHPDGQCAEGMALDEYAAEEQEAEEAATDPRWDALKKILDNN